MLTKQQFKKHLGRLVELKIASNKIDDVVRKSKLSTDFFNSFPGLDWYEDLIVKVLTDAMEDEDDNIGYWLYELNMGKEYKAGCIKDLKGKNIKMKTIDDLYNYLTIKK